MSWLCCGSSEMSTSFSKTQSQPGEVMNSEEPKTERREARSFTFQELANATENFSSENCVDINSFGKVYLGELEGTFEVVTVEKMVVDRSGGAREFLVKVLMLSLLNHPNLINLVGYCAEGDERILVHEYLPLGSLEKHLHGGSSNRKHLDWDTRMKIALGTARGLEYMHHAAVPAVIYRNLKPSNILLDDDYNAKLSDFGLSKLGPSGDKLHVSVLVRGTLGYIAPEYEKTGRLTVKADVYSFGVVLLELITGQRAADVTDEQSLISWVSISANSLVTDILLIYVRFLHNRLLFVF
ncbi:hypothetical protein RND81_05G220700 [Saponaria officinalis]|uniref:Protein kinase domain-containing protein n=1 Tax=Saponaria officinalis TaxID=3572 RepID=A0AAW1KZG3_SAPOF